MAKRNRVGGRLAASVFLANFALVLLGTIGACAGAWAFEIDSGNPDVQMRWDNTVKYSSAWRVKDPSTTLTANPNFNDGDANFKKGLISNRVDLLSEFDVSYKNVGLRLSGAAWHDAQYNRNNDHPNELCAADISPMVVAGVVVTFQASAEYDLVNDSQGRVADRGGYVNGLTADRRQMRGTEGSSPNSCLIEIDRWNAMVEA